MPSHYFKAGDTCWLKATIFNPFPAVIKGVYFFVILDINTGDYWFYPSWVHYPPNYDYVVVDIQWGSTTYNIISPFKWPANSGRGRNFKFWAILTDDTISKVIGKMDVWHFSFE